MNILAINLALSDQLRAKGHQVLDLRPEPGIFLVHRDPRVAEFRPELVIQQETLGPRILLAGLERLECPSIFWSIDTHLNFFWHKIYGRNFDLVLTTQKSWTQKFKDAGCRDSRWLPWFGREKAWTAWDKRDVNIAFVGRITEHRKIRAWMAEFLKDTYQIHLAQGLSFGRMLDLYSRTRFVPNESIAGEINFRIFEASSCGCMVLNQKLMEDITDLYEPGREVVMFEHVLELKDKLDFYIKNPAIARKIAFNGWDKTRSRHLPGHRAMDLINCFPAQENKKKDSTDFRKNLYLTVLELWECGRFKLSRKKILEMLFSLPIDQEVLAAIIRVHKGDSKRLPGYIIPILQQKQYDHDLFVNQTCSVACLGIGRLDLALQFWKRQLLSQGKVYYPADSPLQLYLFWAKELTRKGFRLRPGFLFDPDLHLPRSGLECLIMASLIEPENQEILLDIKRTVQGQAGLESMVLKIISRQSLRDHANWRWNLELAFFNLRSFRLRAGLEELFLGAENARKSGETGLFMDMLAARDDKGYLRACLSPDE
ncbi:MAG: glycosyltransferase family protein [Desulfonatronovibrio sp.]